VLYLWLVSLAWTAGGLSVTLIVLLYCAACIIAAKAVIDGAEARASRGGTVEFAKSAAIEVLGEPWKSFHYVFHSKQDISQALLTRLASELHGKLGCSELKEASFRDIDRDLSKPETRVFRLAAAPDSIRRTRFHFLCSVSRTQDIQGLRWWVLVLGQRDPNKVLRWYAAAPLVVPLVLGAYWRREFEPLHRLTSVDTGFFNSIDTLARTREIEFVAFETLIETLESFGIDSSDLRAQRANILNINVSGQGRANFGEVVQGAFNNISTRMAGVGTGAAAGHR
jgi:hypothetical protein